MPENFCHTFSDIQFLGSFKVPFDLSAAHKINFLREQVLHMKTVPDKEPVLLNISLAGIKVCNPDGKVVLAAHALKRVSYATIDPENWLFSFLAREPKAHFSDQHCHSFLTKSAEQAEELNSLVGNAFKMAYAAQLQKQTAFQDVIPTHLDQNQTDKVLWTKLSAVFRKNRSSQEAHLLPNEMDIEMPQANINVATLRISPPSSIPGLNPAHKYNVLGPSDKSQSQSNSNQSTPCSDENNSPTEMNTNKSLGEKPALVKRLTMELNEDQNVENESYPLVNIGIASPEENNKIIDDFKKMTMTPEMIKNDISETKNSNLTKNMGSNQKRISHISSSSSSSSYPSQETSSSSCSTIKGSFIPNPPPLPERTDSLAFDEGELRKAPWFQAGIPREIVVEVLRREPVGSFMVRESTTSKGCFALSLRVPQSFNTSGISHYLILRTQKGLFRIRGLTKEFPTLTSLIVHHSVLQEILPCPLSLSRYTNSSFNRSDSRSDFADIDFRFDYSALADFRKMMDDINN